MSVLPKVPPPPIFFASCMFGLAMRCIRLPFPGLVMNIEAIRVFVGSFLPVASVSAIYYVEAFWSFLTVPEAEVSFVILPFCSVPWAPPSVVAAAARGPLPIYMDASIIFSVWII